MKILSLCLPACLASLFLIGCSGGPADAPDTGAVSGTITVDGAPGKGLIVTFQPAEGRPSYGSTDDSGYYELTYVGDTMGAKVGKGYFSIATEETGEGDDDEGEEAEEKSDPIPEKYNEEAADNPEMQAEITPDGMKFNLDIKTK